MFVSVTGHASGPPADHRGTGVKCLAWLADNATWRIRHGCTAIYQGGVWLVRYPLSSEGGLVDWKPEADRIFHANFSNVHLR